MSLHVTLGSMVRRSPQVVSATVAGEVVILDPDSAKYFGVEGAGIDVWSMLDGGPRGVVELRDALLERYDVEAACCEADLIAILGQMVEDGLVEIVEV